MPLEALKPVVTAVTLETPTRNNKMLSKDLFKIAVLPGDDIGREIMKICIGERQRLLVDQQRFALSYVQCPGR